jgi:hypothetical protein
LLTEPFSESEAKKAVRSMNAASAPGPDGLGPNFYAATWDTTKGEVMNFLQDFHSESANLECINRALIVLIPKTTPALTPNAFRPVSLQNCPVKILTKILTTRLQQQIPKLIDIDQTGFIKGRSICENFIYATELVQCCHKRRVPTLVIKLDFAKAFDSVNWDSLDTVLHAQGFPNVWQRWMQHLLTSSKSAVMVNGIPGPWIQCRRGLCQGDALSSYLFLLMADVLQRLIKKGGGIRHPLMEGPCPMFQYADDTIILVSGELEDVTRLKQVLDLFSAATGLAINFHKSTMTPMHVQRGALQGMTQVLQCQEGTFPQVYLGLPLSNVKLRLSAFAPLIAKADRYLAGWKATLLSTAAMGALMLPPGVKDALDARRRAFLWVATDKINGAQCLVAWEQACKPKEDGGSRSRE